jgi:hypothetical protein
MLTTLSLSPTSSRASWRKETSKGREEKRREEKRRNRNNAEKRKLRREGL